MIDEIVSLVNTRVNAEREREKKRGEILFVTMKISKFNREMLHRLLIVEAYLHVS